MVMARGGIRQAKATKDDALVAQVAQQAGLVAYAAHGRRLAGAVCRAALRSIGVDFAEG
jgi:hypothetical protein